MQAKNSAKKIQNLIYHDYKYKYKYVLTVITSNLLNLGWLIVQSLHYLHGNILSPSL